MRTILFSLVALVMLLSLIFLLWFIISLPTSYSHRSYQGFLFTSPENHVIISPGLVFLATVIQLLTHVSRSATNFDQKTINQKLLVWVMCWHWFGGGSHCPKSGLIITQILPRLVYCLCLSSRARANICTFGIYWLDQTSVSGLNKDVDNEDWGALNALPGPAPRLGSINQMALTLRGARGDLCGATTWLLHRWVQSWFLINAKQYKQAFPINFLIFMPDIIFYRLCCSLTEITDRFEMCRSNKNEFFLQPNSPASSNSRTLSSRNQIKALAHCQLLFMFDSLLREWGMGPVFNQWIKLSKLLGYLTI